MNKFINVRLTLGTNPKTGLTNKKDITFVLRGFGCLKSERLTLEHTKSHIGLNIDTDPVA